MQAINISQQMVAYAMEPFGQSFLPGLTPSRVRL